MMPVERIASVAVWDTVGALGIPDFGKGSESYDAFRFADTKLSPMVESGFHAVALDEQRDSFIPTLWDEAGNVTQMLFAGAHADVGGGYPLANDESCLSDIALGWMTEKLTEVGVHFAKVPKCPITPNACGPAHMPWTLSPWNLPGFTHRPRTTISRITPHPTIEDRKARCGAGSKPGGK
jgi:uncharacterized protein (DUF2235 family)